MWTPSVTSREGTSVTPPASRTPSSTADSNPGPQMKRHKRNSPLCLESCAFCPGLFRLRLDPGFLDDPYPAVVVLADAVVECGRRAAAGKHAAAFQIVLARRGLLRPFERGF